MPQFDPLLLKWQVNCPQGQKQVGVNLLDFRSLQRIPGPSRPPVYQVMWHCGLCQGMHHSLFAQDQLDLHPVSQPMSCHWDLQHGKMDWRAGAYDLWAGAIAAGRWVLQLQCRHRESPVPGWPSLLQQLQPGLHGSRLVEYNCPVCGGIEHQEMSAADLSLVPSLSQD